jgi:hypothetical protein
LDRVESIKIQSRVGGVGSQSSITVMDESEYGVRVEDVGA